MLRADITVSTLGELATLHVAELIEGTTAWVVAAGNYWTLELNSGAPSGQNVVVPLSGSPIAGLPNARWIQTIAQTFPSMFTAQEVYVNKGGSDTTGDGTPDKPFLTIPKALSTITDASTSKRYVILVAPGEYAESFGLKPWVGITGVPPTTSGFLGLVEITAPADTIGYDPAYTTSGFAVSWMSHLVLSNHQTWDTNTTLNDQCQLTYFDVNFNGGASYIGRGLGGVSNMTWDNCLSYGGVLAKGIQFLFTIGGTQFLGGTIDIEAGPVGTLENTTWLAQNTSVGAAFNPTNVLIKWAAPSPVGFNAQADLSNCSIVGNVTVDGAHTSFKATVEGVPPNVSLLNGAPSLVLQTSANALGYVATGGAGVWAAPLPTVVQTAIDRIAAKVAVLNGAPIP